MTEERAWSLMTKTRGGVVSILRDLTLAECKQAYQRLDPHYGVTFTTYEAADGSRYGSGGRLITDAEIEVREVFGPQGWDSEEVRGWHGEWPKFEFIPLSHPRHPHYKEPTSPSITLKEFDARRAAFRALLRVI